MSIAAALASAIVTIGAHFSRLLWQKRALQIIFKSYLFVYFTLDINRAAKNEAMRASFDYTSDWRATGRTSVSAFITYAQFKALSAGEARCWVNIIYTIYTLICTYICMYPQIVNIIRKYEHS